MRTYHYPVIAGRGKATFPTVALGSLRGSLAFPYEKGRGVQSPWLTVSQTYLSALFNFQRTVGESPKRLSYRKGGAGQERGGFYKSCPAVSLIPLLVLTQCQNPTSF